MQLHTFRDWADLLWSPWKSADGLGSLRSRFVAPGFISPAVRFAGVRFGSGFPSYSLIVQRVDDANHVFSQLFQFLYNKIVYKRCVFPVIPVIQGFRNYGKSVSGTFLKLLNNWNNWENTVFVNDLTIKELE